MNRPSSKAKMLTNEHVQPGHQEGRRFRERRVPGEGPRRRAGELCRELNPLGISHTHQEAGLDEGEHHSLERGSTLLGSHTVGMRISIQLMPPGVSSVPLPGLMHGPHGQASASWTGLSLMHRPALTACRHSRWSLLGPWESGEASTSNAFSSGRYSTACCLHRNRQGIPRQSSSGLLINAPVAFRCPALSPAPAASPTPNQSSLMASQTGVSTPPPANARTRTPPALFSWAARHTCSVA